MLNEFGFPILFTYVKKLIQMFPAALRVILAFLAFAIVYLRCFLFLFHLAFISFFVREISKIYFFFIIPLIDFFILSLVEFYLIFSKTFETCFCRWKKLASMNCRNILTATAAAAERFRISSDISEEKVFLRQRFL